MQYINIFTHIEGTQKTVYRWIHTETIRTYILQHSTTHWSLTLDQHCAVMSGCACAVSLTALALFFWIRDWFIRRYSSTLWRVFSASTPFVKLNTTHTTMRKDDLQNHPTQTKNATQQESIAKREIKELKRKTSVALVFFRAKIFTLKKVSASDQNVGKIAKSQSWYPENQPLSHS